MRAVWNGDFRGASISSAHLFWPRKVHSRHEGGWHGCVCCEASHTLCQRSCHQQGELTLYHRKCVRVLSDGHGCPYIWSVRSDGEDVGWSCSQCESLKPLTPNKKSSHSYVSSPCCCRVRLYWRWTLTATMATACQILEILTDQDQRFRTCVTRISRLKQFMVEVGCSMSLFVKFEEAHFVNVVLNRDRMLDVVWDKMHAIFGHRTTSFGGRPCREIQMSDWLFFQAFIILNWQLQENVASEEKLKAIEKEVKEEVELSSKRAQASPLPEESALWKDVYINDKGMTQFGVNRRETAVRMPWVIVHCNSLEV